MIYPDPLRAQMFKDVYKSGHLNRYTCEFDFIPNILPEFYAKGEIDDYIMTHPIEWKVILLKKGVNSDSGMDEISVEKIENNSEIRFIFTFPRPKTTPECFYALLVFDKNKDWKYFTLELDMGSSTVFKEGGGIICGQKGVDHINYGRRCKEDLNEFQKKVQDIIDKKPHNLFEDYQNIDLKKVEELGFNAEFYKKMGIKYYDKIKDQCQIF